MYHAIDLAAIYSIEPLELEPIFQQRETQLDDSKTGHLNNPKIPAKVFISNDVFIYGDKPKTIGKRAAGFPISQIDPFEADE